MAGRKSDYYKGLTIEFDASTTKVSAALNELNKEFRGSASAARAVDAALKLDPKSLSLVADKAQAVSKQVDVTKQRIDVLKTALAEAKDPEVIDRLTRQAHIAEARLKSLTEQLVKLNVEQSKGEGFGKLVSSAQQLGGTLANIGDSMSSVGDKMTVGLTAPVVAFTAASVNAATTVDTALTGVRKTVDGTEQEYQALKEAAIEYSKTNAVTVEQVLNVQALGAQLGYAKDELEMIGRVGSGLDIATDMNAEQATTEMAQFANITGMAHDKTENYASTVVALGNTMSTTESRISSMAQRVAAAGSQVGMSEADILGLSAALSSMGVEAESGGTNISKIMSQIDKDVATGSVNLATWAAAAGMSATDFAEKWRQAPVEALEALFSGMGQAVEQGGNMSTMLDALGIKSSQAVDVSKRLASGHEVLSKAIETANVAWRENTALSEEVANKNDSLEAKMQMLQNRVTAMLEKVGKPVADALIDIVNAAEPLFDAIESGAQAFADMDEGTQRLIVTAVGAAAALGPMCSIGGRIVSTFMGVVTTLGNAGNAVMEFSHRMSEGATVTEAFANTAEGAGAALSGGLVGVGIAAAIAAAGGLISVLSDIHQKHVDLTDATTGLTSAMSAMDGASASYSAAMDGAADKTANLRERIEDAIKSQAELARSMREDWEAVGSQSAMLDSYVGQIEKLSQKSNLSATDMAVLKNALEQVSSITGMTVSSLGDQSDALSLNARQVRELADAWKKEQASKQAAEDYNAALKKVAEQEALLNEAKEKAAQISASQDDATRKYLGTLSSAAGTTSAYSTEIANLEAAYESAKQEVEQAQSAMAASEARYSDLETAMVATGVTTTEYSRLTAEQMAAIRASFDGTASSVTKAMERIRSSIGSTGGVGGGVVPNVAAAANEAIKAQQRANDARYREQQRAYQREADALSKQLDAEYKAQSKAYDREHNALSKQLDKEYQARAKELDREVELLSKQLDAEYAERSKAYDRSVALLSKQMDAEYSERSKAYDREYQALSKSLDKQYQALSTSLSKQVDAARKANDRAVKSRKSALDKQYTELSKSLAAELAAKKKADSKLVDEARKSNDAEVKAFQSATKARIAAIDEEYRAKLKLLDADPRSSSIDSRIKELEAEGNAEDKAAKERERAEKTAELQREVDRAKSRRKRAEAEKALSDYLLQIEEERRDEARKAEIASLREEQDLIKEDISQKKELLKEEYDQRKETVETERAAELERLREGNELEIEMLREKHELEQTAISEANAARLEQMREAQNAELESYRESLDARIEQMRESNTATLEALRESNSERLSVLKENQQEELASFKEGQQEKLESVREANAEELAAYKESQQEVLTSAREANAEELANLKESQQEQLSSLKEAQQEQLSALKESQQEQLSSLRESQQDQLQTLKDSMSDQISQMKSGGESMVSEAQGTKGKLLTNAEAIKTGATETASRMREAVQNTLKQLHAGAANEAKGTKNDLDSTSRSSTQSLVSEAQGRARKLLSLAKENASNIKDAHKNTERDIAEPHKKGIQGAVAALNSGTSQARSAAQNLGRAAKDGLNGVESHFGSTGRSASNAFVRAIGMADAYGAGRGQASDAERGLGSVSAYNAGWNFADGFGRGMNGPNLYNVGWNIAVEAYNGMVAALDIHSPSRKTRKAGQFTAEGLALGMEDRENRIKSQSRRMAEILEEALSPDEQAAENFVKSLRMQEYELKKHLARMENITRLAQYDAQSMATRYDAATYAATTGSGTRGGGTHVARQEINVSVTLRDVSLSSALDVRSVSNLIARQTADELASQLG